MAPVCQSAASGPKSLNAAQGENASGVILNFLKKGSMLNMKLNFALATIALTLIGASAQAQLVFTVSQTSGIDPLNGYTIFTGFVSNPVGAAPVQLTSDSITAPATLPIFDTQADPILTDLINPDNTFLTLSPGGSHTFDDLFEANLSVGVPISGVTYQLDSNNTVAASYTFAKPTAVPEPGSIALLASSVIGGGLFISRRRRN